MKAVVVTGVNEFGVEDLELLPPGPKEVRVDMKACGLCMSDHHVISGGLPTPLPCVLGHEGAGVIAEVGDQVTQFQVGDHVVLNFSPACGTCVMCKRGLSNFCASHPLEQQMAGVYTDGTTRHKRADGSAVQSFLGVGCMAEEAVVHQDCCVKADPSIDMKYACVVSCGVMTGAGASINTGQVRPGDTVAVFGCGGVGLNAIQGARIAGAPMVIAVDLSANKLDLAKKLGATHMIKGDEEDAVKKIHEITGGLGVDVAIECVGIPPLIHQAYASTRPLGRTVTVGVPAPDKEIKLNAFELTATGRCMCGHKAAGSGANSGQFISSLLGQYQAGNLDLDTLVSQTYKIEDVHKAVEDLLANANARGVFVFD
ncbi:zinc-binding dehydrogenase [Desulfopila sp. IMCC35008]|uniref:zinc-binding dehydrogenase n=1 Tax=Desulfopila sp. IMCC35008 TaxID=2653858 RepID=UPI0013CFDDC3|nr:Zn-dependent alcohol dehydrogenase [Desulfopila sp. IMCC35008]